MINRTELAHSLELPLESWLHLRRDEVEQRLGSHAAKMVGFNQRNPHHCYNLMEHTLHTVCGINKSLGEVRASAELLRVAALLHDIGKPEVAREKQGRLVFYGHAVRSAEIAVQLLSRLEFSREEIALVEFYISHHDDFVSYVLPYEDYNRENPYLVEITPDNLWQHLCKCRVDLGFPEKDVWNDLLLLCCADAYAQAELVKKNGKVTDSREHKLQKLTLIRSIIL